MSGDALLHILLALATIIVAGRALGWVIARLGQPPVMGEVVAGIVLGPSVLGLASPDAMAFLFPPPFLPSLGVLAQLGVILYMFLVGLELNGELLHAQARATVMIAAAGIALPLLLGVGLALPLFGSLAPDGVAFASYALFLGVALAITAFPVLARILSDRQLDKSQLGVLALGCAAVADVAAWCLLAVAVGVAQSNLNNAAWTLVLATTFIAAMLLVVRPVAKRWLTGRPGEPVAPTVTAGVIVAVLAAALTTEAIGIHAVFGAFLLGAVIPHDSAVARSFTRKLEDVVTILLLPAFFAYTGLRTEIGLVSGWSAWGMCGVIVVAATAGKFGGTFVAARLTGFDGRTSAALGVLMNTRGLMELIVLNIGLDLGVISPALFAMMVLMALATTLATTPALRWVRPTAQAAPRVGPQATGTIS